jgi:O-antigen/teichoic acid export membrane protein
LAERFVNLFVQVWLYQYLIKRISPEEYSLYPVVTALLVFVPPLTVILTAGLARSSVEAHTRGDDQKLTEITSTMFPILMGAALVLVVFGGVITKYLGDVLKIAPGQMFDGRIMVALLFGSLALRVALLPFSLGLYIRQQFVILNTIIVSQAIIRVGLLFVLLLGAGPRVLWVVVASVIPDVATLLLTLILSLRAVPAQRFRFDAIRRHLLPNLMSFGFWNMMGSIGGMIRKSSDLLVLNRFATAIDVNTFQLASLTDNQIDAALTKMQEPLLPHMVAVHTTGGRGALQSLYTRGGRYSMWAALIVATPLIAFRHQLWSAYLGPKLLIYADIPTVMVLLLVRYWIEMPVFLIGQAAYAMNQVKTLSILVIVQSFFNLGITIYFVHYLHMGAIGSALGTLVSVVIFSLLIAWKYSLNLLALHFGPWFKAAVWRGVLPSMVAGLFAWGWRYWLKPETLPALLVASIFVGAVYVLSILLFCLDEDERRQLRHLWNKFSYLRPAKASSASK